ncbi:MAG TPA: hypothetical protein VNM72_13875 [Blastocatellia bacterium]|nr:hypothetical protein [Blastocatellia bacterium]
MAPPSLLTPAIAGTLGAGTFTDPGEVFFDASVIKCTPVSERVNVEFRAEFFNLLNNANFAGPNLNIQATTFGRIEAQTNQPRIIQFALRVNF